MRNIVIYRHQLFKPSEGFIFQQTKYLTQYQPIFAGRLIQGTLPNHLVEIRLINHFHSFHYISHIISRNNQQLAKKLALDHPRLIHAHFGVEGVYALDLAKRLNLPLITTFHGFDATTSRKNLLLSKKISWINYLIHRRQLAKEGALFICVSNFIRECLIRLGFPENRIITHYIGVDTNHIAPTLIPKPKKIILHVARLVEKKGTAYLLKAFSILRQKGFDTELKIVGAGPLSQTLKALSNSLEIAPYVQFLGVQTHDQVIHLMQQATIFCLPSIEAKSGDSEGLGMVFLEASACQIPIVATNHGGIPEAVKEGKTGFLVPEKNPEQLAERLEYLLVNETLCEKMGKTGRQFAEQHFNLKQQTQKLESIYNQFV